MPGKRGKPLLRLNGAETSRNITRLVVESNALLQFDERACFFSTLAQHINDPVLAFVMLMAGFPRRSRSVVDSRSSQVIS